MHKGITEDGVIFTFKSFDALSNGDLFLRGVEITTKQVAAPIRPLTPGIELSQPKLRTLIPPKKDEPRLGMMCPCCHQSRLIKFSSHSDGGVFDNALIFTMDNSQFYMINGNNFDIEGEDTMSKDQHHAILIDMIKESDESFASDSIDSPWTMQDVAFEFPAEQLAYCPLCDKSNTFQAWINEYAAPTSEFLHTCKLCGGEMELSVIDITFNGKANQQLLTCESCKHKVPINLGQK